MNKTYNIVILLIGLGLLLSTALIISGKTVNEEKISKPGHYQGYSKPLYKEWVRSSQYVTVRDGTKLAVDIFRPAVNGKPEIKPLPVIWVHHRYHRVMCYLFIKKDIMNQLPWLKTVIKHGYVIAAVDVRGAGASFGSRRTELPPEEALDAYDITEWFAAQPWCNRKVGMFGRSYLGITQYMAATTAPPHLKAIFPEMAPVDLYSLHYPGGVFRQNYVKVWDQTLNYLEHSAPKVAVDEDRDGSLLKKALKEHNNNGNFFRDIEKLPFRDSNHETIRPFEDLSPYKYFQEINESGVAVYTLAGWYDGYPRDAAIYFENLGQNQKIIFTPWYHMQNSGFDLAMEHLRWFDYWLKDIDNGIMEEAPVTYYTMGAPKGKEWRSAWQWPLPDQKLTDFYFQKGPSKSVKSSNDGVMNQEPPRETTGQDIYTVDYSATSGKNSRWNNLTTGAFSYPNMTANDQKGLTYTSLPLRSNLEVTGHPVIHLWVSSTARDGDFFAYLEDVDPKGYSHYITEGVLRASHRSIAQPPFNNPGIVFHRSYKEDVTEFPNGEPVELVFDLLPTSYFFAAGHRIRITITCSDKDNAATPNLTPSPTIRIYRNANYPSRIVLPVITQNN